MSSIHRIYNFSSGPAMLPVEVLSRAREEMFSFRGSGMSVMELSHRSSLFGDVLDEANQGLRTALAIGDEFEVLFLQGGATTMFSLIPMNFLSRDRSADYVVTGAWGEKSAKAATEFGDVNVVFNSRDNGYRTVPASSDLIASDGAAYLHYTSNETIEGVEFPYDLDSRSPIICDTSSNILSKPLDLSKYSMIYSGAQKNIGPSGVTVVIIRKEMLESCNDGLPAMFDLRQYAKHDSMINTPNTWAIYLISLVCDWLSSNGGVAAMEHNAIERSRLIYDAIDTSEGFFIGHAEPFARSRMNVTFTLRDARLEDEFVAATEAAEMDGIRGHRSVGGFRASMYNAFPLDGARALASLMTDFARRHG